MQKNKKLVFRSDGANLPEIGTGHIVRDIAIADSFVDRKLLTQSEIGFISRRNGPFDIGFNLITKSGYQIEDISDECLEWNSPQELTALIETDPDLLIIDRLSTELKWMIGIKRKIGRVVSMDDTGSGASFADVVINGILHYKPKIKPSFVGYDYLFLKPSNISLKMEVPPKVKRIVASFGGYDSRNLMEFFLGSLEHHDALIDPEAVIELLIGFEDKKKIKSWKEKANHISLKYKIDVKISIRPSNFLERLAKADLAVLSGGLTIFDAISHGIPVIGIPQYTHQLKTIENLSKKFVIRQGCPRMSLDMNYFSKIFNKIIISQDIRWSLKKNGPRLIDGKGSERVIKILSSYIN